MKTDLRDKTAQIIIMTLALLVTAVIAVFVLTGLPFHHQPANPQYISK
jgi:hypothetical protein